MHMNRKLWLYFLTICALALIIWSIFHRISEQNSQEMLLVLQRM